MSVPKRIWVWNDDRSDVVKGTWCHVRLYETDTEYIRFDLVAKLKGCAILQEIHRRAEKMGIEDNGEDFTVRISAEDYRGLTEVLKEMGE